MSALLEWLTGEPLLQSIAGWCHKRLTAPFTVLEHSDQPFCFRLKVGAEMGKKSDGAVLALSVAVATFAAEQVHAQAIPSHPASAENATTRPGNDRPAFGNSAAASGRSNPSPVPGQNSGPADATVPDIIVTAQKRAQRAQDIPISLTVLNAKSLERRSIQSASELQYAAPSLSFTAGPAPSYAIRGVGTQTYTRSGENSVSIYVDGVVQGQLVPPTNGLFDLQRVEILSGPQGTLFGRNASAGVISIVTNAPDPAHSSAAVSADVGEHGYQSYRGYVNQPLSSNSAVRISAFGDIENGLLRNRFTGRNFGEFTNAGVRARYLWEPTDTLKINLFGDYEKDVGGNLVWTARSAGALTPLLTACGVTPGPTNTDACLDGHIAQNLESYGGNLTIDWTLGRYTITSITAKRQFSRSAAYDADSVPINIFNNNRSTDNDNQFSQELRLASPAGGRVEYVAGLFYYDYHYDALIDQGGSLGVGALLRNGLAANRTNLENVDQISLAVFGQATAKITDTVNLIGGFRETRDLLRAFNTFGFNPAEGLFIPGFSRPVGQQPLTRVLTRNFSFRGGLQYQPSRMLTLYATYTRGYKGAATNNGETLGNAIVRPEIPTNIEVGTKALLFDRKVSIDIAAFHQRVADFQAQYIQTTNGVTQFVFGNASSLRIDGFEINFSARPIAHLQFDGGATYNNARYGDFAVPLNAYTQTVVVNAKGRQLAGAPRFKLTFSGEYNRPLTRGVNGFLQAAVNYRTDVNSSSSPDPNLVIPGYALVDGRIGLRFGQDRFGLSVFAKNLFDKRFPTILFNDPISASPNNYDQAYSPNAFRTIGISLQARL